MCQRAAIATLPRVYLFTGLVCPSCLQAVARIEFVLFAAVECWCPACDFRWRTDDDFRLGERIAKLDSEAEDAE